VEISEVLVVVSLLRNFGGHKFLRQMFRCIINAGPAERLQSAIRN
jgi:hypothetical protein